MFRLEINGGYMANFFRTIKNIIIGFFSFMLIALCGLLYSRPINDSGLGMSGILAFFLWLVLMFLFFKVSTGGAAVLALGIYIIGRVMKVGISESAIESIGEVIGFLIVGFILWKIFIPSGSGNSGSSGVKSGGGKVCPRCGSALVYVPEQRRPTGEYNDYEGSGHWEYDYSTSQTKSTWVREYHHDPIYETIPAHYECTNSRCSYRS